MRKEDFLDQFEVCFLATVAANKYDTYCMNGIGEKLAENLPYEDARNLALEAWRKRNEF